MRHKNRTGPTGVLGSALRIIAGVTIGILIVGIIVFAPLAAAVTGLIALSGTTLAESVGITIGVIVLTVGFWGGIWWSENRGWARLFAAYGDSDGSDIDEWATEDDDSHVDT